jgi:hypothetical protein
VTEQALPDPLVPADADLRGYDFMPFYGAWLRASDFNATCTDAEYRAAVNLWWASWHQLPPASLPDDDRALSQHADLGRNGMRAWMKVKRVAMSGFVLCADGRWYHEFLSVQARIQWETRKAAIDRGVRSGAARRMKAGKRPAGKAEGTVRNAEETLLKASGNGFDLDSNKGREEKLNTPPNPPGVPPVDNPTPRANGKRHRSGGRWRHDPGAAMAKLAEFGLTAWSHGKTHGQCVDRITQEIEQRRRGSAA